MATTGRGVTDPVVEQLAAAHGVATWYENWQRRRTEVDPDVVVEVLGLLGVDASTPRAARAALDEARASAGDTGAVVLAEGETRPVGSGVLRLEDGTERRVDGALPADLPIGYHELVAAGVTRSVIVTPATLADPPTAWGWMLQLYALRSAASWGMGDLGDLGTVVRRAAADGAGFVLLNPLHAVAPGYPVPASPYSPSSRRFTNPLYLRVSDTDAYRHAPAALRAEVDALRPYAAASTDLIDYDAVWRAKEAALALLRPDDAGTDLDPGVRDFATYCALSEVHGRVWQDWPAELRRPDSPAVAAARAALADRVAFHGWLQQLCDAQLTAVGAAAAGLRVGVVQDLAVGIDPGGADAWMLQDVIAAGVRIGAPPDAFTQLGQDWGLAAWRPDRLAAAGYAPYRDLVRAMLRHAGGLRVDHVAGLWRLWWVPPGRSADQGTYVSYDPQAMVGILALEAHRSGSVVVGEDLGTVLPVVTEGLAGRNMLGCSVLWFSRGPDGGDFTPPVRWPVNALASVSTHDLPTAAGFLTGEHVRVRAELGVLARSEAQERAGAEADRAALVSLLVSEGFVDGPDAPDDEVVLGMHRLLAATPCKLVAVSPYDVLGETRQPNLPGTVDEYPNWRRPLPVTVDALFDDPRVRRVVEVMRARA